MPLDTLRTGRMQSLRQNQQQRTAERNRLQLAPHFGAPPSGFMGEQDYLKALNEDGELARMEAEDQGKPFKVLTNYGAPGLRSARPGVGSNSLGEDEDPMDKAMRQGLATQEYQRGRVAMDEYANDKYDRAAAATAPRGKRALDLGYSADTAQKTGDIVRDEGARTARAEASSFMDPTVSQARGLANREQEALLNARYGRAEEAAAKVEAARLAANAKTGSAQITSDGRNQGTAMTALVRNRGDRALMGGAADQESTQQLDTFLGQRAGMEPPQGQGVDDISFNALVAGAAGGGPVDQLASFWDQMAPDQQAHAWDQLTPQQQAQVRGRR